MKKIKINLWEAKINIEEVVYHTVERRDFAEAVSHIQAEGITKFNLSTFAEAIQIKFAGMCVNMQYGEPGPRINRGLDVRILLCM